MSESHSSPARERVLQAAEGLFSERGYNSVTLRDIAEVLGMRQASLYNHAPGGKEELFVEVTERGLTRHRHGIEEAVAKVPVNLRAQLRAVARWLLSQPPLDLVRMTRSDMPAIDPANAYKLSRHAYESLLYPVEQLVQKAYERGETRMVSTKLFAGTFLTAISATFDGHQY
ncbi:MAG: TetR/AcrR family transcriptional regulator, partial [Chloroflexota bacterium]